MLSRITAVVPLLATFHLVAASAQTTTQAIAAQSNVPSRTASLGTGYQTETELLVGSCLDGDSETGGKPTSSFSFQQSLSEREASSELGLGAGARARFGVVDVSASARFMQNATSNGYSISSVWISDYYTPVERFRYRVLSAVGKSVANNDERWAKTCGDEFVAEIERGAKLFFSIRIDFTSKERKSQFEAQFRVSGPLASAEGDLKKATREFGRDTKLTISGYQIGGDVSKLTAIFGDSDTARQGFVQCTLGDFEKCAATIQSALKYAADTNTGFPSQLGSGVKPGPAELTYRRKPYSSVGIYPNNYPHLDEAIQASRKRLHDRFEEQYALMVLASRLLAFPMSDDKKAPIRVESAKVDSNLAEILAASQVCYNTPKDCPQAVRALTPLPVDKAVFDLPPLASTEFRILTAFRGLLSREESIAQARKAFLDTKAAAHCILDASALGVDPAAVPPCPVVLPPPSGLVVCEFASPRTQEEHFVGRRLNIGKIEPAGSASVVLKIDGQSAVSVTPYFEGQPVGDPIALRTDQRTKLKKVSADYSLVVIGTSRKNPGWLDIDLDAIRNKLAAQTIPNGDGVFSVIVTDAFGREMKVDVEYDKWNYSSRSVCKTWQSEHLGYKFASRLWEPSGPQLANPGSFSEYGSAVRSTLAPQAPAAAGK